MNITSSSRCSGRSGVCIYRDEESCPRIGCQLPQDKASQSVPELSQDVPECSQMTSGETRLGGGSGGLLGELFGTPESHRTMWNDLVRNHRIRCQLLQDKASQSVPE